VLNCFISVFAEQAVARGRALTEELAAGSYRGPLHGIPVSLKDNIETAGVLTTGGSAVLAGSVPDRDAGSWANLARSGAVLVGKNNLWELAFGGPHPDYGPTWNPWDTSRTCGGTSSGSASAVAAGLSFASLGTDTGGSARVPASLCGIVALKPTFGLVPGSGVIPVSYSMDHVCPMSRNVRDASLVLSAMTSAPDQSAEGDLTRGLAGITVGVMKLSGEDVVSEDVLSAFRGAMEVLGSEGASLREIELPDLSTAGTAARVVMDAEASDFHRELLRTQPDAIGVVARNRLQAAEFIPATYYVRAQRVRRAMTDEVEKLLTTVDVIALPAVGVTAFQAASDGFGVKGGEGSPLKRIGRFSPLFNLTGHPAVVLPCGIGSDGMPVSLQLVGRFMEDQRLLAIARGYERATDWSSRVPVPAG
jgi:aspartyl-tRNA(Asn)/glutamyl-tRNA(Gln) amidotransferase subunit A